MQRCKNNPAAVGWGLKSKKNRMKPATNKPPNSHHVFFLCRSNQMKKLNFIDSRRPSQCRASISTFHQRNGMICTAELNYHTLFFLMWQKLKDEDFVWSRCAEYQISVRVPLIQNAHWIVKLCVCRCVYVAINSALPNKLWTALSMNFFPLSQQYYLFALDRHFPLVFCRLLYLRRSAFL